MGPEVSGLREHLDLTELLTDDYGSALEHAQAAVHHP